MGFISSILKRSRLFTLIAVSLFLTLVAYGDNTGSEQKVAIVIMHGDLNPHGLDKAMSDLEKLAQEKLINESLCQSK